MERSNRKKLGDLAEIKHGFAFPGKHIVSQETDRILMTPGHFALGGGFRHNHKKYFDSSDYRDGYELESGDLVVTMTDLSKTGDTLGFSAVVPEIKGKILLHNQRIGKVVLKSSELDKNFCHYLLRSRRYRQHVLETCTGSTVKHTSPTKILDYEFDLPLISDQKAIAHILGTLDDKIELNQKMNQTLEEIAKAIFKSWFVDFDPVRAKAEGRPTGLPPEISDLFPDELVDSEIGEIPKGWSISCIGEHADVIDCLHSKKPTLLDEGFNFLQLNQIGNDGLLYCDGISKISQVDYEKWTSRIEVAEGDCIVTNVGRVGAYARIPRKFIGAVGRNITAIHPHAESQMDFFIADYLSSPAYEREKDLKTDTGTILDALNVKNIPKLRFIYSAPSLIECHRKISRSLWQRRELLVEENQILANLRDTLLPKLISGELRIPDAEKFLEEAGI